MNNALFDKEAGDLAVNLTGAEIDVLFALKRRGPLEIDNIPSKVGLRELLSKKAVVQLSGNKSQHFELTELGRKAYAIHRPQCQ